MDILDMKDIIRWNGSIFFWTISSDAYRSDHRLKTEIDIDDSSEGDWYLPTILK